MTSALGRGPAQMPQVSNPSAAHVFGSPGDGAVHGVFTIIPADPVDGRALAPSAVPPEPGCRRSDDELPIGVPRDRPRVSNEPD